MTMRTEVNSKMIEFPSHSQQNNRKKETICIQFSAWHLIRRIGRKTTKIIKLKDNVKFYY